MRKRSRTAARGALAALFFAALSALVTGTALAQEPASTAPAEVAPDPNTTSIWFRVASDGDKTTLAVASDVAHVLRRIERSGLWDDGPCLYVVRSPGQTKAEGSTVLIRPSVPRRGLGLTLELRL